MDLRYPIGKFSWPDNPSPADRAAWIEDLAAAPAHLRAAVAGFSEDRLNTPYRPAGWTVRQVLHHVPDSHMQSYSRYKLALTEDSPVIKPYHENLWAELPDSRDTPIEASLTLLDALHARWVALLRSLSEAQWRRQFEHPALGAVRLDRNLALYAWHGRHHVAHITSLRERMGW